MDQHAALARAGWAITGVTVLWLIIDLSIYCSILHVPYRGDSDGGKYDQLEACPLVVRREGYFGGKPALRDDPRVPPEVIYENIDDGMTAEEVIDSYSLRTSLADVLAVYAYAKAHIAHPA